MAFLPAERSLIAYFDCGWWWLATLGESCRGYGTIGVAPSTVFSVNLVMIADGWKKSVYMIQKGHCKKAS